MANVAVEIKDQNAQDHRAEHAPVEQGYLHEILYLSGFEDLSHTFVDFYFILILSLWLGTAR